ncbi:hypothetical protein ACQCSV_02390 [Pseudarthrobacter sp. S3]|uniref:hypothetical protein n=1 Tax=Pseudarthrobacter sp. S3 TaxID=3418419 RepID=UPI003CFA6B84
MLKSLIERPALLVSELGLLLLGLVLALIGFVNFVGAFTADRLAFVGAFIFLLAGAWCLSVSLIALLGHPRSTVGRATLVAVGWIGGTYPLSGALTYLGSGAYITALPIAVAGIALALFSIRKKRATSPSV